jgi:cysteine desulfurase
MRYNNFVYLDNYATIPCSEENVNFTSRYLSNLNASAPYSVKFKDKGYLIEERLKQELMSIFKCSSNNIIINSGGSEGNSNIIYSLGIFKKGEIVCSSLDHASILNGVYELFNRGVPVKILEVKDGLVEVNSFDSLVNNKTVLLILSHVFSEIGNLNEVEAIAERIKKTYPNVHIHVDAVQSFMKVPVKLIPSLDNIDSISGSFHKIGGVKGCGFLWVKEPKNLVPLVFGHHNNEKRGGTINVSGIASAYYALQEFKRLNSSNKDWGNLEKVLRKNLLDYFKEDIFIFTNKERALGNCIIFSIKDIDNRLIQNFLYEKGVIVGTGSACNNECNFKTVKVSPIIKSFNVDTSFIKPVRVSWNKKSSLICIESFLNELIPLVYKIRGRKK